MGDPAPIELKTAGDRAAPRVGRQFGWLTGGRLAAALLQVVTLGMVARWAGPEGFGAASIAMSFVVILQTATDLGLPTFVARERALREDNPALLRALIANNFTASAMAVLLLVILGVAGLLVNRDFLLLLPMAVWAAADRNTDAWLGVAMADGDTWLNSTSLVVRRILTLILLVVLVQFDVPVLLAFAIALAAGSLPVNLWAHHVVRPRLSGSGDQALRPILRSSAPYWINSVGAQLRNLDVVVVGVIAGGLQTAFYAAAGKLAGPLLIVPTSMSAVLVPAAARMGTARLREVVKPVLVVLAVTAATFIGVIALAPWLLPSALGDDYRSAVVPVQVVSAAMIFAAASAILVSLLQGVGRGAEAARISVASTVTALGAVCLGAALDGAVGAACGLAFSFVAQALALATIVRQIGRTESRRG